MKTDLIPESEAALLSGLSIGTLTRFADAGYLRTREENDGTRLFSRNELESVFGIKLPQSKKKNVQPESLSSQIEISRSTSPSDAIDSFIQSTRQKKEETPIPEEIPAGQTVEKSELEIKTGNIIFEAKKEEKAENYEEETAKGIEPLDYEDNFFVQSNEQEQEQEQEQEDFQVQAKEASENQQSNLDDEISRLKNVIALQEQVLKMKDSEIGDLKGQRNWLRERVEKLEDKADRDQLLLLSETQMITRMLTGKKKRSPVVLALEWLGIRETSEENHTIEIK